MPPIDKGSSGGTSTFINLNSLTSWSRKWVPVYVLDLDFEGFFFVTLFYSTYYAFPFMGPTTFSKYIVLLSEN